MQNTRHLQRRRFVLQSVTGSLLIPSLASLAAGGEIVAKSNESTDASTGQPRRFVAIGNLLGFQQKSFFPEDAGKTYDNTTLLTPLNSQREKFTVYRGLDHGLRGGHFAVHTFLSGVLHHESKNRHDGNITLDQYIADSIGGDTRFPSLTVGSEGGIHGGCQLSWTRSGVRVPPITGPAELFDKLFVADTATQRTRKLRDASLQASILDSVTAEAGDLAKRINSEDRNKLDEYFSSIRDVERRLQTRKTWTDKPKPVAPFEKPANTNTVDDLPILYELIALALQTDSTRVATLEIGGSFLPQNMGINKSYHSMSHHGNDEDVIANLLTLETYQVDQFSKFLARISGMTSDHGSLLDTTAVLFGSGMGNGSAHTNTDLPIILAGGGYETGEFKKLEPKGVRKTPLSNLFVDIARRSGIETDSFGTSTGSYS
ncbi:MAG: hypothetical protein CMM01_07650 [Rhodopirellula sp.]|nr:hypothetical protein [Rhodopirellula sp.]